MNTNESHVRITREFYRGSSPTSIRLESRVKELEDLIDLERNSRIRSERLNSELTYQVDALTEKLDEFSISGSQYNDAIKKRDQDIQKLRNDLTVANLQLESVEQGLRKKYNNSITELSSELETLNKSKGRAEKDKNNLMIELEGVLCELDSVRKARNFAESKAEALDGQLNRLKGISDDLQRQVNELDSSKAKLLTDVFNCNVIIQEYTLQNENLKKIKSTLELQVNDLKKHLDDESRMRITLHNQLQSLRADHDNLQARYDEECDTSGKLRAQISKLNTDFAVLKGKYEKEIIQKTDEFEDMKRKLTIRINECIDEAAKERARASGLEKTKQQLTIEIKDLHNEISILGADNNDLVNRLKHSEALAMDLQKHIDDLTLELNSARSANNQLASDNMRMKAQIVELIDKNSLLDKDNINLINQVKELKDALRDASIRIADLEVHKSQLEADRNNLAVAFSEAKDALKDLEQKYHNTHNSLIQLKADMEQRLREKDDELEGLRRSTQRTIEELTITITEIESKYKSEISRLKKKYETALTELQIQLDSANQYNVKLVKDNNDLARRISELERELDDERRAHEATNESLMISERKRVQLHGEVNDLKNQLEASDRAKKNAENEAQELGGRVAELTLHVNTLTNEKRRLEGDLAAIYVDLNDTIAAKQFAEDRIIKLNNEINRLADELRQEQENYKKEDSLRRSLEIEIREIRLKLEETEAYATAEGKRIAHKLQVRIRELESELEAEQKRCKDAQAQARKFERQFRELQQQADEDRRMVLELQDLIDKTQLKMKAYKRQLEEIEDASNLAMSKYRKAQQQIEDAEHRADVAERHLTVRRAGSVIPGSTYRAVSVIRESSILNNSRGNRATSIR